MATVTREDTANANIKIRMREPLRAAIENAAAEHKQSMNSEMVSRLSRSFDKDEREDERDTFFGGRGLREIACAMAGAFQPAMHTYLQDLLDTGAYGKTLSDVARTLIEEGIRRAIAERIIEVRRRSLKD